MFSYVVGTLPSGGGRSISRVEDGIGIGVDRDNRDARLFVYEWMNGASVVDIATGLPVPFSPPELTTFNLDPVLDWPLGT